MNVNFIKYKNENYEGVIMLKEDAAKEFMEKVNVVDYETGEDFKSCFTLVDVALSIQNSVGFIIISEFHNSYWQFGYFPYNLIDGMYKDIKLKNASAY